MRPLTYEWARETGQGRESNRHCSTKQGKEGRAREVFLVILAMLAKNDL